MSTPGGQASVQGGGPSIRLNLQSKPDPSGSISIPAAAGKVSSRASSLPPSKKRRFDPPTIKPNTAHAHNLQVLHQKSSLSFLLNRHLNTSDASWFATGITTLYVVDDSSDVKTAGKTDITTGKTVFDRQFALHLRGTCSVTSVEVESLAPATTRQTQDAVLIKGETSFQHFDPLERVLLKPASSYTMDDVIQLAKNKRHQADSQAGRGAAGMTNAIRAAGIASNMGELRISSTVTSNSSNPPDEERATRCWKHDLNELTATGEVVTRLETVLEPRFSQRKSKRIDLVATTMAKSAFKASKITIRYDILLGAADCRESAIRHLGGIHALTTNWTPHIYTTTGVYGDHEGPRSWIPILDSAATRHRASHDFTIKVTAPMKDGLSVVGFGEDFGASETVLHDRLTVQSVQAPVDLDRIERELGKDHVGWLRKIGQTDQVNFASHQRLTTPHVIPLEFTENGKILSIDAILATSVWTSCSWLPISPRSIGFAIGPFRIIDDPEYFSSLEEVEENAESEGEDDDEEKEEKVKVDRAQIARDYGEGVRQAFFAPIFARKYIHENASKILLTDTKFDLSPMTKDQIDLCEDLEQSVLTATIGVPTRALSLMRDVLALPSFRTVSYTQVWIPDAVHGGSTSGALNYCPEAQNNPFLGGSIMDSRLLPPIKHRLPYSHGGRVLQFLQARCAARGWIVSAIPLGGRDDVGNGYIHTLLESLIMSLYERGHGAFGQGGGRGGAFFTQRYAAASGLNSSNLDFLPIQNIEDTDFDIVVGGIVGGTVPVEDRNNDQLWRSASNGTESHTSAMDEFAIRQLLTLDAVNALERGSDKDRPLPTPSMGWMGSHLSLTFLSSNANSSSELGCGAVELHHPTGGLPYRSLKSDLFRRIVEGRAGISNFIRLVRAAFVAAHLADMGHTELKYPPAMKINPPHREKESTGENDREKEKNERPKPRFVVCVNEILKKKGLSHTLFTRALQNISGRVREAQLLGTLVDVERDSKDPRTNRSFVDPEGFPNSYVRGSSELYLRVGVHVEPARDTSGSGIAKGIQLYSYAEPVIPEGGIAYGGPITFRVVENEGQFREFVKDLSPDGSRRDWGSITLHAKPVTLPKAQTAASGIIESGSTKAAQGTTVGDPKSSKQSPLGLVGSTGAAFTYSNIHKGGYQAIELIRITNLTPLLWARVDPMCLYGGRISVFQPDACLAEMLFHDGDAGAQVDALRALAERPLKIQGSVKISSVYDVGVGELPVRVLGDCLRGTPALHSSLPHPPAVRAQAALAIAQWQNNKAPRHRNDMAQGSWVGLQLLIQYFRERFYNSDTVMPVKFNRVVVKKNDVENTQTVANPEGTTPTIQANEDDGYRYLDDFDEGEERAAVLEEADEVDVEEDGEYRVRSAVITAIASIRAKDGMTPPSVIKFLETVLEAVDAEMAGNIVTPDEEVLMEKKRRKVNEEVKEGVDDSVEEVEDVIVNSFTYASNMLVADALLALCHVNASPEFITDPTTAKVVQSSKRHPVCRLIEISRRWLDWELYRERIRGEKELQSLTGISGQSYVLVPACAITALFTLSILRNSTTDPPPETKDGASEEEDIDLGALGASKKDILEEVASASFYISIYDSKPDRSDVTRAACAQAIACIYCAADRFENSARRPLGLLNALEFMLDRILDPHTSPGLRQTLGELMIDACSGKICSLQRVASIGGRNDLVTSTARFLNGPLGASHGGDSGSAIICAVNPISHPAASAVNDGARRGLRLIMKAGKPKEVGINEELVVRVARFATNLWRMINGEPRQIHDSIPGSFKGDVGVCATDGHLRCTLLALWQWLWPRGCYPVLQVQARKPTEWSSDYRKLGVDKVMRMSEEEMVALSDEESSMIELHRLVSTELDRQIWRGEMAMKAYDIFKATKLASSTADASATEQGIGQPLPPIKRDACFKQGGWIASTAHQRRATGLDGGTAVTKIRVRKSADT
ncbi:hypothetical protein IV203_000535 [Nitzschia inconspicua]|uniref:Uncharacterized protein n=1 Tax=Nitzschia inconspicua TaxID=303405 RepID=A0A9K3L514_9STRA|nr:hypothetical protein IV203_000535 [Nitzschia inconspicua]